MKIQIHKNRIALYRNNDEIINIDINGDIKKSIYHHSSVLEMESLIDAWKEWKSPKLPEGWILESVLYPNNDSLILKVGNKGAKFIFDEKHTLSTVTKDLPKVIQYLSDLWKVKH